MTQVWIGVSRTLGLKELITRYIDPFYSPVTDEYPTSELVKSFGAARIKPGEFEVYDRFYYRKHLPGEKFDHHLFSKLCPFSEVPEGLTGIDHDQISCMFFISNRKKPDITDDGEVIITDVLDVEFDWEKQDQK